MTNPDNILKKYPRERKYLISILHEVQAAGNSNHLTEDAMRSIARHLNISLAAVFGVAEYYSMFSISARGKTVVSLCSSPVCRNAGSGKILKSLLEYGFSPEDITFEKCECLGHCDHAPVLQVGNTVHGDMRPDTAADAVKKILGGRS